MLGSRRGQVSYWMGVVRTIRNHGIRARRTMLVMVERGRVMIVMQWLVFIEGIDMTSLAALFGKSSVGKMKIINIAKLKIDSILHGYGSTRPLDNGIGMAEKANSIFTFSHLAAALLTAALPSPVPILVTFLALHCHAACHICSRERLLRLSH